MICGCCFHNVSYHTTLTTDVIAVQIFGTPFVDFGDFPKFIVSAVRISGSKFENNNASAPSGSMENLAFGGAVLVSLVSEFSLDESVLNDNEVIGSGAIAIVLALLLVDF